MSDWRKQYLKPKIKGKRVLNLGCGGEDRHLQPFLEKHSSYCLGLELDDEKVEECREAGLNVVQGNAEHYRVNEDFDVVFAGDLIEHLTNFDGFFQCSYEHLRNDGVFYLNTPNIRSVNRLIRGFLGMVVHNPNHNVGFDEIMLKQLLSRYEVLFNVENLVYFNHSIPNVQNKIIKTLSLINEEYKENIMVKLKKK